MPFYDTLLSETRQHRDRLIQTPIIQECLRGEVTLPGYVAFLREAYHHVRHTVPLMHSCRARIPARLDWLDEALDEYIEEETGHDEWILNDLRALGEDADAVKRAGPGPATEIMVAYAYDTINRNNPVGFFGMVHVLEGTSVALALNAADRIQQGLGLPPAAFSYLRSHGTLDQEPALLAQLDLVVASVHSKLRMEREAMTRRMVMAIANPNMDILGHCTGRYVTGKNRPESDFDAEVVFEACRQFGKAVEINSRPERLDPPRRLLSLALEMGCLFAIDSDAHAPGQLDWQPYGCDRAEQCGVPADRIVNTRGADALVEWARGHG